MFQQGEPGVSQYSSGLKMNGDAAPAYNEGAEGQISGRLHRTVHGSNAVSQLKHAAKQAVCLGERERG